MGLIRNISNMNSVNDFIVFVVYLVVFVIAITVHEFSHAVAAYKLGDDTAKRMGRITLNPLKSFDLVGTLMILFVGIGWAKPVMINPYNFQNMKRDMALSAAAGPASNFIMSILAALILNFGSSLLGASFMGSLLSLFLIYLVFLNIMFGLFNLLPIPPLDGSKIIGGFMPDDMYFKWTQLEKRGFVFILIFFGVNYLCSSYLKVSLISVIIGKPLDFFMNLLVGNVF